MKNINKTVVILEILATILSIVALIITKDIVWTVAIILWINLVVADITNNITVAGYDRIIDMQGKIIKGFLKGDIYKDIKLEDIKILPSFSKSVVNPIKFQSKIDYYNKYGTLKETIIIDSFGNLVDGYTSYIIAKNKGIKNVKVKVI